jgi:tetratricopeptide (TPR) repeat protein
MKGLRPTDDVDSIADSAERALSTGEEESAIPLVRAAAERHHSALLWQWTALLERSLDEHQDALRSFGQAQRLAPGNGRIAHGLAQTAMEAGLDAVGLFERAHLLAPQDGAVLVGLAAARNAAGEGERAASDLDQILERAPMWTYGHEQLAQLLAVLGRPKDATKSIERALQGTPASPDLWRAFLEIQLRRREYQSLKPIVERAAAAKVQPDDFRYYLAVHEAELSDELYPEILFAKTTPEMANRLDVWRVRHLLRLGAVDAALPIIEVGLNGPAAHVLWPYAAIAWRIADDRRLEWLEGNPDLVCTFDLKANLEPLDRLAAPLSELHLAKGEFLDQSVRGGTQTDGPLFKRIDPIIRQLRSTIVGAVETYRSKLSPVDPNHPLLRHRRDRRVRFSGSWSVRLRSGGSHSNHVHPQGWISSALYVSLPQKRPDDAEDAGWLTLGEPDDQMQLSLPPQRKIEPKAGHLVLFPSWMWHGTVPFSEGERLTVAFDVSPPV